MVDVAMMEHSSPEAASSAEDPVPAASGLGARPGAMAKEEDRNEEDDDDIPPQWKEYGWKKSETVWALEDEAPDLEEVTLEKLLRSRWKPER